METFEYKLREASTGEGKGLEVEETGDIVTFARERLGFDPDEKQEMVLRGGRRGINVCSKQKLPLPASLDLLYVQSVLSAVLGKGRGAMVFSGES